jgi:prevent-host-death family protein
MDITKDIQPMTTLRNHSADILRHLRETKRPVVLTVNGNAVAVVQEAEAYQRLLDMRPAPTPPRASARVWTISRPAAAYRPAKCSTRYVPSMALHVENLPRARRGLRSIYAYIHAENSRNAHAWLVVHQFDIVPIFGWGGL